ncbi:solute carrier family 23 member 2-like isoform X5 [Elephas maximus indicus]|uniref:solute carrier family 23 member 2-like isoform X5 n=1 Tax=Elephas maximus indicus TaxID=99487 RepID=UPI002115F0B9|nr:solute carrier family 23 member 2-like isoform X5 [Elephas maximus indicus]
MNPAITSYERPDPLQSDGDVLGSHPDGQGRKKSGQLGNPTGSHLAYGILDTPPWHLCIFLGIQHFLTALGGLVAVPLILAKDLCLQHDPLTQSYLISTIFFVSGICTLLQVFLGVRLPILQGGTFAFLAPSLAMLSLPAWRCPEWTFNASLVNTSSPEFTEEWQKRIREDHLSHRAVFSVPEKHHGARARVWTKEEISHLQVPPVSGLPGQWGLPTISLAGVCGIIAGVISSMVESVGDYYACARLVGAPTPPRHAINRGIGIEGLGCLLAGAWGTGNGTTSYSENVGVLGITQVGSRMVIVAAGCVLLLMGVFGKIGAAFATIPTPVIGGMFLVMFGVITAVGISNLQYVDMNSSRNLFVFGFSIYCGLAIPNWVNKNPERLQTGDTLSPDCYAPGILQLDQVIQVLLTTGMFVGGSLGFLLDNTIPGSVEERGLLAWNQSQEESEATSEASEIYGLPCGIGTKFYTSSCSWCLPFWPQLEGVRKREVEVSQLTLCSLDVPGYRRKGDQETRM